MTGYVQTYPTEPVFSEPQYDSYIIIDHTHDLLNPPNALFLFPENAFSSYRTLTLGKNILKQM